MVVGTSYSQQNSALVCVAPRKKIGTDVEMHLQKNSALVCVAPRKKIGTDLEVHLQKESAMVRYGLGKNRH